MYLNSYIYSRESCFIKVIPLPNRFNFVVVFDLLLLVLLIFLLLCYRDVLPLLLCFYANNKEDDYINEIATLVNYYDCEDDDLICFLDSQGLECSIQ